MAGWIIGAGNRTGIWLPAEIVRNRRSIAEREGKHWIDSNSLSGPEDEQFAVGLAKSGLGPDKAGQVEWMPFPAHPDKGIPFRMFEIETFEISLHQAGCCLRGRAPCQAASVSER